jgi:dTDP-4-dehydrorhamnose 3,5-epimerase
MIEGVKIKALRVVPDDRGRLMELLRADDEFFEKFGQVYVTTTYPGVVKAWHKHEKQADNMACISGMIKLVLYDPRRSSPTRGRIDELFMGVHHPILVHIPPGVHHGWKCVSETEAIVVNAPTEMYDHGNPDEQRLDPHSGEIPYDWTRKDR